MSVFSPQLQKKIEHYLQRYETRRSAILPILHEIQDECEWIQESHILALESEYDLHRVQVREVATFYSMYRLKKPKKYRILFCNNIVCNVMGGRESMAAIKEQIAAKGEKSDFSLEGVPCLGVCGGAPAMLINKDRYLDVNPAKALSVMANYKEVGDG